MRVRRLLAAMLTTGLIAPTALVIATSSAPASAATATKIVGTSSSGAWFDVSRTQPGAPAFGDKVTLWIGVADAATGERVYGDGSVVVQQLLQGSSTWTNVASNDGSYLSEYAAFKIVRTATYRVIYSGDATYSGSSAAVAVKAQRKLTAKDITGRKVGFKGKISPAAKTKITVERKVGKKWKSFRKQATSKKGTFRVILPAITRKKTFWRVTFKGSKGYVSTAVVYWTRRY